jgi:hypothetical protein
MPPNLIVLVVETLLQEGPVVAAAVQKLLSPKDPDQAAWDALFASVQNNPWRDRKNP